METRWRQGSTLAAAALALVAADSRGASVERKTFGTMATGEAVELFTLRNGKGVAATIMSYGGIVVSLTAPEIGRAHV